MTKREALVEQARIDEAELDELSRRAATVGYRELIAALEYQGENPRYYRQGKLGSVAVASYVRRESTKVHVRQLDIIERRMALEQPHRPMSLPSGE